MLGRRCPDFGRCENLEKYVINGGRALHGEVEISGAKNAAVAIIPAALMVDGVCRLENIPQISDADMLLTILSHLGSKIRLINRSTIEIDSRDVSFRDAPFDLMSGMGTDLFVPRSMLETAKELCEGVPDEENV